MSRPEFLEPEADAPLRAPEARGTSQPLRSGHAGRRHVLIAIPVVAALVVGGLVGVVVGSRRAPVPIDDATAKVRESAGRTTAAGSSRIALDVNLALGVVDTHMSGDGVLDLKNGRGSVDLDLPVGSVSGVLSDGNVFVKIPAIPTKREWVKLDLAEIFPDSGSPLGPLGRLASADPALALATMAQSAGDMKTVGPEPVRGVATTHSRGTFDLGTDNSFAKAVGTALVPLDVWIDGDGRLRKMTVKADPDGPGPLPASSLDLEMYDFGVPADITAPAANQVLTDLTGPMKAVAGLFS